MRSTPTSPLFPYTTLFRSGTGGRESRLQILEHLLQLGTKVRAAHQGAGRIERYLPGEVKESLPGGHFDQLGIATRRGQRGRVYEARAFLGGARACRNKQPQGREVHGTLEGYASLSSAMVVATSPRQYGYSNVFKGKAAHPISELIPLGLLECCPGLPPRRRDRELAIVRSEEHTSELQSP